MTDWPQPGCASETTETAPPTGDRVFTHGSLGETVHITPQVVKLSLKPIGLTFTSYIHLGLTRLITVSNFPKALNNEPWLNAH